MKRAIAVFIILSLLAGGFAVGSREVQKERDFLMGLVANPKNHPDFTIEDIEEAYTISSTCGELAHLWLSVPWWEEEEQLSSASAQAVITLMRSCGLTPIFHTNFWELKEVPGEGIVPKLSIPPDMPANTTLASREFRERWISHVEEICREWKPAFYSLGNEVDLFYTYEANQPDFDNYVSLVAESYDAIKNVSPCTRVMVIFKMENLMDKHSWFLIDRFQKEKIDLFGFTSYPYINETYMNEYPSNLPPDYYAEIPLHTGEVPIAFTEIGWSSSEIVNGNEEKQDAFLQWFLNVTHEMQVEMICWLFLHDMAPAGKETKANEMLGLRRHDGEEKAVWQRWRALHDMPCTNTLPEKPEKPSGALTGKINTPYTYTTSTTDDDGDCLYYLFDWGDSTDSGWIGPFPSGEMANATHEWAEKGEYAMRVKAKDLYGESGWSDGLSISMPLSLLNGAVLINRLIIIFGRTVLYHVPCFNGNSSLEG